MNLVRNVSHIFSGSKIERRRQIINIVFQNLELDGNQLRWEYKKPFDSMALSNKTNSWLGMRDSNPRMPGPEPGALPLGQSPIVPLPPIAIPERL